MQKSEQELKTTAVYNSIMQDRESTKSDFILDKQCELSTGDISAGFPDEDCLVDAIDCLGDILCLYKGKLKPELNKLLQILEDTQSRLYQAAEYAREELRDLEKVIDEIKQQG